MVSYLRQEPHVATFLFFFSNISLSDDTEYILTYLSQDTRDRVLKASIETVPTDISFVTQSDYILSIVPPRDALATAKRIITALFVFLSYTCALRIASIVLCSFFSVPTLFLIWYPVILARYAHTLQQRSTNTETDTHLLSRFKRHFSTQRS